MKVTLVRSTVSGLCGWLVLALYQHCSNSQTHAPASLPSSSMHRWPVVSWTVILSIVPPSLPSSAASAWRQGIPPAQCSLGSGRTQSTPPLTCQCTLRTQSLQARLSLLLPQQETQSLCQLLQDRSASRNRLVSS